MKKASTKTSSAKRLRISEATRRLYRKAKATVIDTEAPVLSPEMWDNAVIGKYYRPIKTQVSIRLDNEIIDWLRSKGSGHLTKVNEILRRQMEGERTRQ